MKTRFAPSPTGYMHLGNARTALFNFLFTKSTAGSFLLRIEDSDLARSKPILSDHIQTDLLWLGLAWDEGPGKEKNQGPYFQSQRQSIYAYYYKQLEERGHAYPCFCTDQELKLMRKQQLARGKPPRYNGCCRQLSRDQIAEKKAQGEKSTLRFQVAPHQTIQFIDLVKGEQVFASNDIGDFVIQRSDGSAAFFFCNAIDDALMGVTHVLRGEDHLTNTPRQIMLLKTLDLSVPIYGHIALIVGEEGAPLSKREGSLSIETLRRLGYFPEALQNYLARLGHSYSRCDFLTIHALSTEFSLERLGKSSARYDDKQLFYWQKQALLHIAPERLMQWMGQEVENLVPPHVKLEFIELMRATIYYPVEAVEWAHILFGPFSQRILTPEAESFLKTVDPLFWDTVLSLLEEDLDFKSLIKHLQEKLTISGKALFTPLRLALTGRSDGPEIAKLFTLIGRERIRERIQDVKNL